MKRNVMRTEGAKKTAPETKITANKAGESKIPPEHRTLGRGRQYGPYGRYLAGLSRLWNSAARSRRDDTPPAASAVGL